MLIGFDRVRVDGPFIVEIRGRAAGPDRVVGPPSALATVQVRVEGRTLIVAPARDDRARAVVGPTPTVELSADRLAGVVVQGSARVHVERMAAPRIDLAVDGDGRISGDAIDAGSVEAMLIGAGTLTLSGRTGDGRFLVNGSGTVDAAALDVDTLSVRSDGSERGAYRARYVADVSAYGTGTVTIDGKPQCHVRGTAAIRCG
ncbi:DUF2807 domain-containing protein [Nostoc sp. 3335mG]|nr:DUF2807 domain-containing protein [Nostoc sp. 3335mG]